MASSDFQEKINQQGEDYINTLKRIVRGLWVKACEEDGIDPTAKFVVFSKENKCVPFHNKATRRLQEAEKEYAAGGYVGLKIEDGKAK